MARTPTKKLTRDQRDRAAARAADLDLRPAARVAAVVLGVLVITLAIQLLTPGGTVFGGPLQEERLASTSTMSRIPKPAGGLVTFAFFVPWNAGEGDVTLEEIEVVGPDGIEIAKAGVLPAGTDAVQPDRGYPPPGLQPGRIAGAPIPPGSGPLDQVQVVVALRGRGTAFGFLLRYGAGDRTYTAVVPQGAVSCAAECEALDEAAAEQSDWLASLARFVSGPAR